MPSPSLFRPRNLLLALLGGVVLSLGLLTLHIARLTPGKPGKFNAQLQKLIEDAQPGTGPDGWPLLVDALALSASVSDPFKLAPRPADWPQGLSWPPAPDELDPASPRDALALRELIARHERAGLFAALDRLAAADRVVRPIPSGRLIDILLPELLPLRAVARLSQARFKLAVADGDEAEALRSATHLLTLAHLCQKQSTVIEHLVAAACDAQAAEAIQAAACSGRLSPRACRDLLALLDARAPRIDVARAFKGEHLFAMDVVEWTHSDDGRGDGSLIPSVALPMLAAGGAPAPDIPPIIANFASLAAPSKKSTLGAFERFYTLSQQYAGAPLRVRASLESPDAFVQSLPQNMLLVRYLTPALSHFVRVADATDLDIAAAKVMLALELHRAAHHDYPPSLDALDPPLASLRIDPQWPPELRYRPTPPPSDNPAPYLLYWIGMDGRDNQGAAPAQADRRSLLNATDGLDFVFTPRRPPSPAEAR